LLAFIIIENGHSCYFQQKWGLCYPSVLLKMVVDAILTKIRVVWPLITFLDFWWRPFLGQKSVGVSRCYY
jgi:hypothetical protein